MPGTTSSHQFLHFHLYSIWFSQFILFFSISNSRLYNKQHTPQQQSETLNRFLPCVCQDSAVGLVDWVRGVRSAAPPHYLQNRMCRVSFASVKTLTWTEQHNAHTYTHTFKVNINQTQCKACVRSMPQTWRRLSLMWDILSRNSDTNIKKCLPLQFGLNWTGRALQPRIVRVKQCQWLTCSSVYF